MYIDYVVCTDCSNYKFLKEKFVSLSYWYVTVVQQMI